MIPMETKHDLIALFAQMGTPFKSKMVEVLKSRKETLEREWEQEKQILRREDENGEYSRFTFETEIIAEVKIPQEIEFVEESIEILEKSMKGGEKSDEV